MATQTRNITSIVMALATALAVASLVILLIRGMLAPQGFALCCAVVMVVAAVIWFLLLRTRIDSSTTLAPNKARKRRTMFIVAGLAIFLPISLWATRGGPWLPRLIGTGFLIALLIGNLLQKD